MRCLGQGQGWVRGWVGRLATHKGDKKILATSYFTWAKIYKKILARKGGLNFADFFKFVGINSLCEAHLVHQYIREI